VEVSSCSVRDAEKKVAWIGFQFQRVASPRKEFCGIPWEHSDHVAGWAKQVVEEEKRGMIIAIRWRSRMSNQKEYMNTKELYRGEEQNYETRAFPSSHGNVREIAVYGTADDLYRMEERPIA